MSIPGEKPTEADKSRVSILEELDNKRTAQENNELQELYLHRWLWNKLHHIIKKIKR